MARSRSDRLFLLLFSAALAAVGVSLLGFREEVRFALRREPAFLLVTGLPLVLLGLSPLVAAATLAAVGLGRLDGRSRTVVLLHGASLLLLGAAVLLAPRVG